MSFGGLCGVPVAGSPCPAEQQAHAASPDQTLPTHHGVFFPRLCTRPVGAWTAAEETEKKLLVA